jgi:hypothetical protein
MVAPERTHSTWKLTPKIAKIVQTSHNIEYPAVAAL